MSTLPSFRNVLRFIAGADGKLKGHPNYLTKYQMIRLAKEILKRRKK